ncbi:MAG: cadmium-translocating P-type ATPase [Elusimicrobiota bacterium]|jgi:Cd2+/Zn2+-exporting ATPase|nr:cadmium-translocating P-type ATPase [Elusimicrobiota bacterium]
MNNAKHCCSCLEDEQNHNHKESSDKSKYISTIIGIAFFISAFFVRQNHNISVLLFLAAYLLIGWRILLSSFKNILKGRIFDENSLMSIATICAFIIGEYPESAAVMLFYQIGMFFEDRAVGKSRKSISDLINDRPDFVFVKRGGEFVKSAPESVSVGDIILVKGGEKIALDGTVIDGNSILDMSALTGEAVPYEVFAGKIVLSGSINISSILTIRVDKEFKDSTVSKILDLLENAVEKKAKTQNFITKFAAYYTPIMVALALMIALLPPLLIETAAFQDWIGRALIFLVMSCPCALVISVPLAYYGAIGGASKQSILIKGSNYLEALSKVSDIVFDKTGTLTKGKFKVKTISAQNNFTKEELIFFGAYCEHYNLHPIAQCIKNEYGQNIDESKIKNYKQYLGMGISAIVDNKTIIAGNAQLLKQFSIDCGHVSQSLTIIYISIDNKYAGYIEVEDEIKADAKITIQSIKNLNIKTTMLTGDIKAAGEKTAQELQIESVYTNLLPHQKAQIIEDIKKEAKGSIVFMGDGINDAPVLAGADIGIAMGALGSDAAIEAADIVFMNDEPSKIITLLKIAKKTKTIIMENIIFALGIKFAVLILGVFAVAQLWMAVFADVGVTLIAVLNSMRAMKS